jgi:hypothetical protein
MGFFHCLLFIYILKGERVWVFFSSFFITFLVFVIFLVIFFILDEGKGHEFFSFFVIF